MHPGEEAAVRTVQGRLAGDHPGLLAIVVPRHPERGPEFAGRLAALGVTESLPDNATAETLREIWDLDLSELQAIIPPCGFGTD